jgi:hypothetical protein
MKRVTEMGILTAGLAGKCRSFQAHGRITVFLDTPRGIGMGGRVLKSGHQTCNAIGGMKMPVTIKDVEARKASAIYDRLMGIVGDIELHLAKHGHNMRVMDFKQMHTDLVGIQSAANVLYIASHEGSESNG